MSFNDTVAAANTWLDAPITSTVSLTPGPVLTAPSWVDTFFSTVGKVGTNLVNTVGSAATQSLSAILLQKAGLVPKSTQQGGGTVINYDRAQPGVAPIATAGAAPVSVNVSGGSGALPQQTGLSNTTLMIAAGVGLVLVLLLVRK